MKLFFFLIVILILAKDISNAQFAWEWQNPKPQGNTLKDVFFTDTLTGYAVGVAGTLIKTTDGGNNWNRIYCGTWDILNTVYFTDAYIGYIAGEKGRILKTTDAGQHWDSLITNTTRTLYSIVFVNNNTGYAAGDSGTILKTTNGGTTWNTLTSGTANRLLSLSFIDENNGMATGNNGTALKTTDGGATWQLLNIGTTDEISSVFMTDTSIIYFTTRNFSTYGGAILKSTDGGNTFTIIYTNNTYLFNDIFFLNADTGYVVGRFDCIYKTSNGGNSWSLISNGSHMFYNSLNSVFFIQNRAYTVGLYGKILMSLDKGNNWNSANILIGNSWGRRFYSIFFTDNNTGFITSDNSIILKTDDSGATWSLQNIFPNDEMPLLCSYFPNKDTGYVFGYSTAIYPCGKVFRTIDGGSTWTNLTPSIYILGYDSLLSAYFINGQKGFVAGKDGSFFKTIDAGNTWETVSSTIDLSHINFNCIRFINNTIGYLVGSAGSIYKTTDGGNTWDSLNSGTTANLVSVHFFNNDTGIVAGNGLILRTFDGGNTWLQLPVSISPNDMFFTGSTGYIVGFNGKILKTTDGGNTWNFINSETKNNLEGVWFLDSLTGVVFGYWNPPFLLKTITGGLVYNNPVKYTFSNLVIYPNPSPDFITINNNENATIQLFNIQGKLVLTGALTEKESKINISNLANGMYIVKVISPKNIKTTKIIKE